jgi:hypothetical protein
MDALAALSGRIAGQEGEREMLTRVRERLPPMPDGTTIRSEGFVAHTAPALSLGIHALVLLIAGVLGFFWPAPAAIVAGAVTLSYLAEGSGRVGPIRWWLPLSPSYNLVVRQPTTGKALGTVVFVTPLDAARKRPLDGKWLLGRRPGRLLLIAGFVVTVLLGISVAEPWGARTTWFYIAAMIVVAASVALGARWWGWAGEGKDDASGPAAMLELMRRLSAEPIAGMDVWYAFVANGHAYQAGMTAFLDLHKNTLADPVLVLSLRRPGRPPLRATQSEGTLFAQPHLPTGPALLERLGWAGVSVPVVDFGGASDARAATVRGFRAVGITGGGEPATPEQTEHAVEVVETAGQWFAADLATVAGDRAQLQDLARATEPPPRQPLRLPRPQVARAIASWRQRRQERR